MKVFGTRHTEPHAAACALDDLRIKIAQCREWIQLAAMQDDIGQIREMLKQVQHEMNITEKICDVLISQESK